MWDKVQQGAKTQRTLPWVLHLSFMAAALPAGFPLLTL